jgi:hypothetical protein
MLDQPDLDHIAQLPRAIAELKSAIAAINLPPPLQQAMHKQMQAMESQARELLGQQRKAEEQQVWIALSQALLAGSSVGSAPGTESNTGVEIDGFPKGIDNERLREFLHAGPADDNDESCRQACIALEVFGEIESPQSDKKARMQYQLGRLTQGLGQQVRDPEQHLLAQINAFIALRPQHQWAERFCSGLKKIRA